MCIITEKLISLFIQSSDLAYEYDTVTNMIRLSCMTIALSATKKLGPDKKRFNAMAAIYGLRKCNTGISRQDYWAAVREENDLEWRCPSCPLLESTRREEEEEASFNNSKSCNNITAFL